MIVVLAAPNSTFDAGSVGLWVSHRVCRLGGDVLFVDLDATGNRLAERLGDVQAGDYSPASRGLPTLMVSRQQITIELLRDHCYSLDAAGGDLWALFAPLSEAGAKRASVWLSERTADLSAISDLRTVIVSASLVDADGILKPFVSHAAAVCVLAPVASTEEAAALWRQCADSGLMALERDQRWLILEGESPLEDEEVEQQAGLRLIDRTAPMDDSKVLRRVGSRKDRQCVGVLDAAADRLHSIGLAYADGAEAAQPEVSAD